MIRLTLHFNVSQKSWSVQVLSFIAKAETAEGGSVHFLEVRVPREKRQAAVTPRRPRGHGHICRISLPPCLSLESLDLRGVFGLGVARVHRFWELCIEPIMQLTNFQRFLLWICSPLIHAHEPQ